MPGAASTIAQFDSGLIECFCIVYQTLRESPRVEIETRFVVPGQEQSPVGIEGVEDAEAALRARLQALRTAAAHAL